MKTLPVLSSVLHENIFNVLIRERRLGEKDQLLKVRPTTTNTRERRWCRIIQIFISMLLTRISHFYFFIRPYWCGKEVSPPHLSYIVLTRQCYKPS